jgi:hypothetical protein
LVRLFVYLFGWLRQPWLGMNSLLAPVDAYSLRVVIDDGAELLDQ